jgi:hypothetical protein
MIFNILFVITALGVLSYIGYVTYRLVRYERIQRQRQRNSDDRLRAKVRAVYRRDIYPLGITSTMSVYAKTGSVATEHWHGADYYGN